MLAKDRSKIQLVSPKLLKDGLVFDYIQRIELKSWKSYRPLGQIALDMDLVHIAWAMDLANKTAPLDTCLQSTSTALL